MIYAPITRLILYTRRVDEMVRFYELHFGYKARQLPGDRIIELVPGTGGTHLLLHPASKGAREGQVVVKLVFDVQDVPGFIARAKSNGLEFGAIHHADGYDFANAKDPSKNAISISSRAFVRRD